jgi:hypothetical protein
VVLRADVFGHAARVRQLGEVAALVKADREGVKVLMAQLDRGGRHRARIQPAAQEDADRHVRGHESEVDRVEEQLGELPVRPFEVGGPPVRLAQHVRAPVARLLRLAARPEPERVAGRQFAHALPDAAGAGHIAVGQVVPDGLTVEAARHEPRG